MTAAKLEEMIALVTSMASRGLRCICLSYRDYPIDDPSRPADFFEDPDQVGGETREAQGGNSASAVWKGCDSSMMGGRPCTPHKDPSLAMASKQLCVGRQGLHMGLVGRTITSTCRCIASRLPT